jgi:hypothetical protein
MSILPVTAKRKGENQRDCVAGIFYVAESFHAGIA